MVPDPKTLFGICCELDPGIKVYEDSLLLCSGGLPVLFLRYRGSNSGKFLSPTFGELQ